MVLQRHKFLASRGSNRIPVAWRCAFRPVNFFFLLIVQYLEWTGSSSFLLDLHILKYHKNRREMYIRSPCLFCSIHLDVRSCILIDDAFLVDAVAFWFVIFVFPQFVFC